MMGEDDNNNSTIGSIEYINFIKDFGVDKIEIGIRNYSTIFVFEDLALAERFINYLLNKKDEGGYTGDIDNFLKQIARLSSSLKELITKLLIKKINENLKNKLLVDDIKKLLEELKDIDYENNILDEEDVTTIDGKKIKNKDITNVRKNLNKINEDNKTKKQNTSSKDSLDIKTIRKEAALARKEFIKNTTQNLKDTCRVHNNRKAFGKKMFSIFSGIKKAFGALLDNNKIITTSGLTIKKGGGSITLGDKKLESFKGGLTKKDNSEATISKIKGKNVDIGTVKSEDINKNTNTNINKDKDINRTIDNSNNNIGKDNNNNKPINNLNNDLNNDWNINNKGNSNRGNSLDNNSISSNNIINDNSSEIQANTNNNHNIIDKLKNIIPNTLLEENNRQKESVEKSEQELENITKDTKDNSKEKDKEEIDVTENVKDIQKEEKEINDVGNNESEDLLSMFIKDGAEKLNEKSAGETDDLEEIMNNAEKGTMMTHQPNYNFEEKKARNQENQKIVGEHSEKFLKDRNSNGISGPNF